MTDNEIIKALQCCLDYSCSSCPCEKGTSILCIDDLHRYALDLINRQKAEIERLNRDYSTAVETMSNSIRTLNNLVKEMSGDN